MKNKILREILKDNPNPSGYYCFSCGNAQIKAMNTIEGQYYLCPQKHKNERVFYFDDKTIQHIEKDELLHEAVGAIIRQNSSSKPMFLLFFRRKFPFLYTIPAGHVEKATTNKENIIREVKEETNLSTTHIKQLWPDETFRLFDPCRRGADMHYWHIFEIEAQGTVSLSDEGRIIGWYSEEEIQKLAKQALLTKPVHYFFKRYFQWQE